MEGMDRESKKEPALAAAESGRRKAELSIHVGGILGKHNLGIHMAESRD